MKLLFDQNLSPRLLAILADVFPGSRHVRDLGLADRSDEDVWRAAIRDGFHIVSKDSDFHQMSFVRGFPPKVIWIRTGNCSTSMVEEILRSHVGDIRRFADDATAAFLCIG